MMGRRIGWTMALGAVLLAGATTPALAQTDIRTEIIREIDIAGSKFTGLSATIPAAAYDWRPEEGVRSVREVFLHVIGNNYNLAWYLGAEPPAGSGITQAYATVVALEAERLEPAEITRRLEASFAHLRSAILAMDDAALAEQVNFFGQQRSRLGVLVLIATHLHEHLGQSIAYARSNGVVPPWSG